MRLDYECYDWVILTHNSFSRFVLHKFLPRTQLGLLHPRFSKASNHFGWRHLKSFLPAKIPAHTFCMATTQPLLDFDTTWICWLVAVECLHVKFRVRCQLRTKTTFVYRMLYEIKVTYYHYFLHLCKNIMSKRPVFFQDYSDSSKKRSRKIFIESDIGITNDVSARSSGSIGYNVST